MHESTTFGRRGLLLGACAVSAAVLGGCKIQPIDGNRAPLPWRIMPQLEAYTGPEGGDPARLEATPADLNPAARAAVKYRPLGAAGDEASRPGTDPASLYDDELKVPDRWRIGFPSWERGSQSDSPWDMSAWWDPYHQNVLKGDYPLPGTQNTFLSLEVSSITRYESRQLPTPSGVFPRASGDGSFFGEGQQTLLEETLLVTLDMFHGETSFKPVDWRIFLRGAFNWNETHARERNALFADPANGVVRNDDHAVLQQAFFETTLASVSEHYDVIQARLGTQQFNSDFRGFIFFDEALGARVFGNWDDNLWQWNLGYFRRWDKDTNSGLNTYDSIRQRVLIANVYRQDVLAALLPRWKSLPWSHGLTTQLSYHHFSDDDSVHYDENGALVRPRAIGVPTPNDRSIHYLGWTNDGHVGRINVTSALYNASGHVDFDEIAGRAEDVDAWMAALELSIDMDWMRFRTFGLWQSGDDDPLDGDAHGFDGIFDNPNFAGGEFGFWNRNGIRLTGTNVGLVQRSSLYNSLRSSKDEGAPAYVNPGLLQAGVGYDAQITPHLKLIANASYLAFDHVDSLELVLNQDSLGREIGYDLSVGAVWRPLLTDNVIVKGGVAALVPGHGFRDIYGAETLHSTFLELILTW